MDSSFVLEIALALGAGVLLNLTPCVLPVIPIKVRTILRGAGEGLGARAVSAALFALGSVSFFAALGLATALLHLQWGVLFQSRAVLVGLVVVMLVLAAASFSARSLPVPAAIARVGGSRHLGPFASGLVGGVLSTPCTGPLLGGVLVFALTRPPADIVALFVAIGLGMALPYVALLLRPALLARLPRGGAWAEVVRKSFGWLLLGGAVFFAQSLLPAWVADTSWIAFLAALVLWAAVTALRASDRRTRWAAALASMPALAIVYLGAGFWPATGHGIPWQPLRAGGVGAIATLHRPALVEFTAQWCLNCRILEKTVYRDPAVARAVRAAGAVPLQADLTRPNPILQRLLARYGGAGIPFLAILDRNGREVGHLSGLFTAGTLIERLSTLQPVSTAGAAAPADSASEVSASVSAATGGATVILHIARGWHVYANPPSAPYLIPASVRVLRDGRALDLRPSYPPGTTIGLRIDGRDILVYEDGTQIGLPGLASLRGTQVLVRVQACEDKGVCLSPATLTAAVR
ncbi:MAG: cytochrome c biogenesis protein CcdA [Lysobacter sp.]